MSRLKTGTRGEHLTTRLWCVTARLVVTCLATRLWCVTVRPVVTCLATRLWCVTARLVVTYLATRLWCVTARLVVTCLSPFSPVNDILIVRSSSCVGHEMLWPRGRCLVTKIWTWMQVNLSKMLTRMTKRGAGILTD